METIPSFTGKILFLIRAMEKEGLISKKDQGNLKDLLFDRPQTMDPAYQDYLNGGTQRTFKSDLLKIVKRERQLQSCDGSSSNSRIGRKGGISIKIPKRTIQKLPQQLQRL